MGTQWRGMGLSLMRLSRFRDSILRSDEAVKPLGLQVSHERNRETWGLLG